MDWLDKQVPLVAQEQLVPLGLGEKKEKMECLEQQEPPVTLEQLVPLGQGERREIVARMDLPAHKGHMVKKATLERQGHWVNKVQQVQQEKKDDLER